MKDPHYPSISQADRLNHNTNHQNITEGHLKVLCKLLQLFIDFISSGNEPTLFVILCKRDLTMTKT